MAFGHDITWYLARRGHGADGGIAGGLSDGSDAVGLTKAVWAAAPWTRGYAVIRHVSGGRYAACDRHGRVHIIDLEAGSVVPSGMDVLEYVWQALGCDGRT